MKLVRCGRNEIDAHGVGDAYQVGQHVSQLLADPSSEWFIVGLGSRFVGREPLEQLAELTDLADEGEDQGLGVVEPGPIAFRNEFAERRVKGVEVGHGASMTDSI